MAAATPPAAAQRAFPVIIGIAALPVSVWLVAAALLLSEDPPVLEPVAEVEAEVVSVDAPVDAAVEAEAESPVVAEAAAVPVPVIVTGIIAPGISVIGTAVWNAVVSPLSFMLMLQETDVASYWHFSEIVL
jgi:hypothetical protein